MLYTETEKTDFCAEIQAILSVDIPENRKFSHIREICERFDTFPNFFQIKVVISRAKNPETLLEYKRTKDDPEPGNMKGWF